MSETAIDREPTPPPRHAISLWAGVVGAPALWLAQLQVTYALVPWVCGHGHNYLLHLSWIVFLLLAIVCGVLCWREWNAIGTPVGTKDQMWSSGRAHFLCVLGLMTSALFSLVIIAQGLAAFFYNPCWD